MTYDQIGEALGITRQSAHKAVQKALQEIQQRTAEEATELRALECERLDEMGRGLWAEARKGNPKAVEKMLKVMERRAKLIGLDAPTKHAATNTDGDDVEPGVFVVPAPAANLDDWLAQVQTYQDAKEAEKAD